ncbi:MAG: elongation factor Ts [Calditrichaeota bacterium]|nr:elongation factor Ts [Calditrichota bacterium]MCB9366389.1 elongation factor Ts [Calditrichota bacterium]MCB9391981.1 elongation factor Ts [Calditrichota bacterium]
MSDVMINAADVAMLRRETGAGMMDCKKALTEAGGDRDKALEILRKKGQAAAEKRAERSAEEGVVAIVTSPDGSSAALAEVRCETDFVGRNEDFRGFAKDLAELVLNWSDANGKSVDDLSAQKFGGSTVGETLTNMIGKIGEKLEIARFAKLSGGHVGQYVHSDSKLGVLVALDGVTGSASEVQTLGRDLAMQVAASSPEFLTRDEVPADKINAETEIEKDRARQEGKPEPAVAKIAEGRVNKWLAGIVLLEQPFIKEPKMLVKDVVAATEKTVGKPIQVKSFVRFRVGA